MDGHGDGGSPKHAPLVLATLIGVASVANLNLAVANVALPNIGIAFHASQTQLNLVSVGFSLGLAGTVLYLGALGDRYGRKMMLLLGMALTIPAALLAAFASSIEVLFVARFAGGVAAGMAYPTTLALITALWTGQPRTRAIALWSATGGAMMALASLLAGWLLSVYWWGSVFVVSVPLAAAAFVLVAFFIPAHVEETDGRVDNLGGALSVVGIVALVLAINFAPSPGEAEIAIAAGVVAFVALVGFFIRQARAAEPLFDLHIAARRTFLIAAIAGLIVFGTLMAAMFIGEQYLQNVLGYSTLRAGAAVLPAAAFMLIVAPQSARLIERFGSRITLLAGYTFLFLAFIVMLVAWTASSGYGWVALAFSLVGIGVGLAGTPASHSLTGSVPVKRAGMASGTADLQRDLGGAIMQSLLGAILTAGYASAAASRIAQSKSPVSAQVTNELERSFSSATAVAQAYPHDAAAIIAGARDSFLEGANWAYAAGAVAIVLGALVVAAFFPKKDAELAMLDQFHRVDSST